MYMQSWAAQHCLCKIMGIHSKFYLIMTISYFLLIEVSLFSFTNILLHFVVLSYGSPCNLNASINIYPYYQQRFGQQRFLCYLKGRSEMTQFNSFFNSLIYNVVMIQKVQAVNTYLRIYKQP